MNTEQSTTTEQNQKKGVTIIVNGRPRTVEKGELSFDEIVRLAFPNPQPGPDFEYTVTYSKGTASKPEGTLVEGQSVKVKEGMIFNVTETNKS